MAAVHQVDLVDHQADGHQARAHQLVAHPLVAPPNARVHADQQRNNGIGCAELFLLALPLQFSVS
jgi:hypothetical protein